MHVPILEPQKNELLLPKFESLDPFPPTFFVSRLSDKPHNPITRSLKLTAANRKSVVNTSNALPPELGVQVSNFLQEQFESYESQQVWKDALEKSDQRQIKTYSWDELQVNSSSSLFSTPFLSEQSGYVFAAARYIADPRFAHPRRITIHVTQDELLNSLKTMALGFTSPLFRWDSENLSFVQQSASDEREGRIIIDGKDEALSTGFIARFKTIGSLLRRMEHTHGQLRARSKQNNPTTNAYAHALLVVSSYLRDSISATPPFDNSASKETLFKVWSRYEFYEDILSRHLAPLLGCHMDTPPSDFSDFSLRPQHLISRIYDHLAISFRQNSLTPIKAVLAYLLTRTSDGYLRQVYSSVGLGISLHPIQSNSAQIRSINVGEGLSDDTIAATEQDDSVALLEAKKEEFPRFFPEELLNILPSAQQSLTLLQTAQPNHPLLGSSEKFKSPWLWTSHEIFNAWNEAPGPKEAKTYYDEPVPIADAALESGLGSRDGFEAFCLFDQEPGQSLLHQKNSSAIALELRNFICKFPATLPSITPNLEELTSLTFQPLVHHASTISNALLSFFLTECGELNLQLQLEMLRSYLLACLPSFRLRLTNALFSDSADHTLESSSHGLSSVRRRAESTHDNIGAVWSVGLSPALTGQGTWPPVGSDLSYSLRAVIVDAIELQRISVDDHRPANSMQRQLIEEAEKRLGFAIRDLPSHSGAAGWLNPLSTEALDFLYMDYKPPLPLGALIGPDVLSKYQRLFTFILRVLRVENGLKSVFRMARPSNHPLFPTLVQARKELLHFRYLSQLFVSQLSAYVFDIGIGGTFDAFLSRLHSEEASNGVRAYRFPDVFALAHAHSNTMDNILGACMLRSGQRNLGDELRQTLEIILEFAVVVGKLKREHMQEYEAAPLISEIFSRFSSHMSSLCLHLKQTIEKDSNSLYSGNEAREDSTNSDGHPSKSELNVTGCLAHLLLRLDSTDWWARRNRPS